MNGLIAATLPSVTVAVAVAVPAIATVGADVYPVPAFVTINPLTLPLASITAVAAAALPPPPLNVTAGADVYPLPAFVIVRPDLLNVLTLIRCPFVGAVAKVIFVFL